METVTNYLANSIVLDGVRAEEIKKALAADVNEELLHARNLGERIKQLGGSVPGSLKLTRAQEALQPPSDTTDVTAVIDGVLSAENAAIDQYYRVIRLCEGVDYVTQELAIRWVADEEDAPHPLRGLPERVSKTLLTHPRSGQAPPGAQLHPISHRGLAAPALRSATRHSRQRRLSGLDRLIPSSMDASWSMALTRA